MIAVAAVVRGVGEGQEAPPIRAHARMPGSASVLVLERDIKFARTAKKCASPAARGTFMPPIRGASGSAPRGTSNTGACIYRIARLRAAQSEASVARGTLVEPVLSTTDAVGTRSTDTILAIAHLQRINVCLQDTLFS